MTTITPRERVWTAIRHQAPDRVPWHVGCTLPMQRKLDEYYGTTNLDDVLGNHMAKYRARPPFQEVRPGYFRDEFGVVWNRTVDQDIGVVEEYPLTGRSLAGYRLPDPRDPARYAPLPRLPRSDLVVSEMRNFKTCGSGSWEAANTPVTSGVGGVRPMCRPSRTRLIIARCLRLKHGPRPPSPPQRPRRFRRGCRPAYRGWGR